MGAVAITTAVTDLNYLHLDNMSSNLSLTSWPENFPRLRRRGSPAPSIIGLIVEKIREVYKKKKKKKKYSIMDIKVQ